MNLINWIQDNTIGADTVVEFGCMRGGSLQYAIARRKVGIEAWKPYLDDAHPWVDFIKVHGDIRDFESLLTEDMFDTAMFVDVIEHLPMDEAVNLIKSLQLKFKKIIIMAPEGNHPQTSDVTGYGAHELQTHRSTWRKEDLDNLGFNTILIPNFHSDPNKDPGCLFATWTKS